MSFKKYPLPELLYSYKSIAERPSREIEKTESSHG